MVLVTTKSMVSSLTNRNNIVWLLGLLSILLVVSDVSGEPPSVVPSACKRAYAAGGGSFTEGFCLSAFNGHSAGAADNADLALIAVDLAMANATATEAKIDAQLLGGSGAGALSEGLRLCRDLYDAVVHVYLPECHAAVNDGRYVDGKLCLRRTSQAPVECERWFEQRNVSSPVTKEDDTVAKLTNLAMALTSIA